MLEERHRRPPRCPAIVPPYAMLGQVFLPALRIRTWMERDLRALTIGVRKHVQESSNDFDVANRQNQGMGDVPVNVDNFERAETSRMFQGVLGDSGGVNEWMHNRTPTPLDHQPVIRQNRDTLYSGTVVDISRGATLTLPNSEGRYLAAMPINQDGYVNAVFYDPGSYELTTDVFETEYLMVAVRVLVDPSNPDDVAAANALQDQVKLSAESSRPFAPPSYDQATFAATRGALIELARGLSGFEHAFGSRSEVDPVRHLIACAAAWGGLPDTAALYLNVEPHLPVGEYHVDVPASVPVDGFWSISLYNADGYLTQDTGGRVSLNNLTAKPNADGSTTVHFGGPHDQANVLPLVDGWNYMVRLYRPRSEILDGSWRFPGHHACWLSPWAF